MAGLSEADKARIEEAKKNVDIAGQLNFDIKAKEKLLDPIKKSIIKTGTETRVLELIGKNFKAKVSVVPGSYYPPEDVWKYLREEAKLSEAEALKYFSVKAGPFKEELGVTAAATCSKPGGVIKKVILKKLK